MLQVDIQRDSVGMKRCKQLHYEPPTKGDCKTTTTDQTLTGILLRSVSTSIISAFTPCCAPDTTRQ